MGAACTPAYLFLLPGHDTRSGTRFKHRLCCINFLGTMIMCGSFSTGIIAISFDGTHFSWGSGTIIGRFVASRISTILFLLDQWVFFGRQSAPNLSFGLSSINPDSINILDYGVRFRGASHPSVFQATSFSICSWGHSSQGGYLLAPIRHSPYEISSDKRPHHGQEAMLHASLGV